MNVALARQLADHPKFRWKTGMLARPFPDLEQGLMPDLDDPGTVGLLLCDLPEIPRDLGLPLGDTVAMGLLATWGAP